jgi:hypothetical protein
MGRQFVVAAECEQRSLWKLNVREQFTTSLQIEKIETFTRRTHSFRSSLTFLFFFLFVKKKKKKNRQKKIDEEAAERAKNIKRNSIQFRILLFDCVKFRYVDAHAAKIRGN